MDDWAVTQLVGPLMRGGVGRVVRVSFGATPDTKHDHGWLFSDEAALELAAALIRAALQARHAAMSSPEAT